MNQMRGRINLLSLRKYATQASEPIDFHRKHGLPPWPSSKNPTPHEIFDIKESELSLSIHDFNKKLKQSYLRLIKIYHPDVSTHMRMSDSKNKELTEQTKRDRFDRIQSAYDLLKDPKKRIAYKNYTNASWENYNPQATTFEAYRMANAHRKQYSYSNDEEFWRAGTWEDYYQMKYKRPPPTKEEINRNKYKILTGVLIVCALSFSIQLMMALDRTREFNRRTQMQNLIATKNINDSMDNYGEGLTSLQRMRRFLIQRRSVIPEDMRGDLQDESYAHVNEDNELLRRYAQKKVEKFT